MIVELVGPSVVVGYGVLSLAEVGVNPDSFMVSSSSSPDDAPWFCELVVFRGGVLKIRCSLLRYLPSARNLTVVMGAEERSRTRVAVSVLFLWRCLRLREGSEIEEGMFVPGTEIADNGMGEEFLVTGREIDECLNGGDGARASRSRMSLFLKRGISR